MAITRRDFIKYGAIAATTAAVPVGLTSFSRTKAVDRINPRRLPRPYTLPFKRPASIGRTTSINGVDRYNVRQQAAVAEILPGYQTPVFTYNGSVPGPTFDVRRGSPIHVRNSNDLPMGSPVVPSGSPHTSTHLHGSASLPQYDGYADDIKLPGQWKNYWYPNSQNARTMWYHDHGVHHTARTAYNGLFGFYRVHDDLEESLPIPHLTHLGDNQYNVDYPYDVPLVLSDAVFAADGSLFWDDNGQDGLYGNVNMVNGVPWPFMSVEPRKYRFRILGAAVSRSFEYYLDNGHPLTVIANDGGFLPYPVQVQRIKQGSGERYEVIIDFAPMRGKRVRLLNANPKNNNEFNHTNKLMEFRVGTTVSDTSLNSIPDVLDPSHEILNLTEADVTGPTRQIFLGRRNGLWSINDTFWDEVRASNYEANLGTPTLGSVEVWEIINESGGWFHPLHIHFVDFQILSRNGLPPEPYEIGPKDVVYVGEEQIIRVLIKFGPNPGRYMVHCHNLVHEDHDMMHQYIVLDENGGYGDDPVWTDPALPGPVPEEW
jgi:spore coat protein A, manganese oxidase